METHGERSEAGSLAVLQAVSATLGGSVPAKRLELNDGSVLTHVLRGTYRSHKIELAANEVMILADIEALYGRFQLLIFDERPWKQRFGKPAAVVVARGAEYPMYTLGGLLCEAQTELLKSGALVKLLEVTAPQKLEQLDVSQRLVRVKLQHPTAERLLAVIDAVIETCHMNQTKASLPTLVRYLIRCALQVPYWRGGRLMMTKNVRAS